MKRPADAEEVKNFLFEHQDIKTYIDFTNFVDKELNSDPDSVRWGAPPQPLHNLPNYTPTPNRTHVHYIYIYIYIVFFRICVLRGWILGLICQLYCPLFFGWDKKKDAFQSWGNTT